MENKKKMGSSRLDYYVILCNLFLYLLIPLHCVHLISHYLCNTFMQGETPLSDQPNT